MLCKIDYRKCGILKDVQPLQWDLFEGRMDGYCEW